MNLHNLFGNENVVVLDDGDGEDMGEVKEAFEELEVCTGFFGFSEVQIMVFNEPYGSLVI